MEKVLGNSCPQPDSNLWGRYLPQESVGRRWGEGSGARLAGRGGSLRELRDSSNLPSSAGSSTQGRKKKRTYSFGVQSNASHTQDSG